MREPIERGKLLDRSKKLAWEFERHLFSGTVPVVPVVLPGGAARLLRDLWTAGVIRSGIP